MQHGTISESLAFIIGASTSSLPTQVTSRVEDRASRREREEESEVALKKRMKQVVCSRKEKGAGACGNEGACGRASGPTNINRRSIGCFEEFFPLVFAPSVVCAL